jgi:hypothetical protein
MRKKCELIAVGLVLRSVIFWLCLHFLFALGLAVVLYRLGVCQVS